MTGSWIREDAPISDCIHKNPSISELKIGDIVYYTAPSQKKRRYCKIKHMVKDVFWGFWSDNKKEAINEKGTWGRLNPDDNTIFITKLKAEPTNWRDRINA